MYAGERFNAISHLVGTILALIGTGALVGVAVQRGNPRIVAALVVYGLMLTLLFTASTLYHSVRGPAKKVLHIFDHCAIYLLIAGTYTPFTLVTLRGPWGWTLFGVIWTLALAGILKDVFFHGRFKIASVVLYLVMGWLVVAAFAPLQRALPPQGIFWLAAGGVAYTAGIAFFALSKRVAHTHGLWHLCVMGGSACHYIAVLRYVALT
jgi:hemolysin III